MWEPWDYAIVIGNGFGSRKRLADECRGRGDGKMADGLRKVCFMLREKMEEEPEEAEPQEGVLYVTDLGEVYTALQQRGCFVLPYLHEKNRNESFPGAFYAVERLEEMDYTSFDLAYCRLAGLPWNILETKRLMVRETTVGDVDSFYRIYQDPSVTAYMENLFADRDEEIAYIRDYIRKVYAFYGYGMWTVMEKGSGEIIGRAGISWREGYDLPELGFVIGVPWQRQGYAYEVCRAILVYAWKELGIGQIQALVMEGNERSAKLCKKLGFSRIGTVWEDGAAHILFRSGYLEESGC